MWGTNFLGTVGKRAMGYADRKLSGYAWAAGAKSSRALEGAFMASSAGAWMGRGTQRMGARLGGRAGNSLRGIGRTMEMNPLATGTLAGLGAGYIGYRSL